MVLETYSAVAAVRRFNRFYTRVIGALDEAHLGSPYSLAEMRVLYEVAQQPLGVSHKALAAATGLDAGYLTRILQRFTREGLMERQTAPHDARAIVIRLTGEGIAAYGEYLRTAEGAVESMVVTIPPTARPRLVSAMGEIEALLKAPPSGSILLRPHRVGDMGWVIQRHAAIYAREYGWGLPFEALVTRICADFLQSFDPERERCWIAERDGEPVGSILLAKGDAEGQARLRLLLVETSVRGQGLGKRLVEECLAFARAAGYAEIVLWTQSILTAARGIYAEAGFELIESWPNDDLGVDLISETWRLDLHRG